MKTSEVSCRSAGVDMEINEIIRIKAIGNLLQYYHSDLVYILNFQRYKQNSISRSEYLPKSLGSFQSFLNEFRVARCVRKGMVGCLLDMTIKWVSSSKADDVDSFAAKLRDKKVTHNSKTMTSLASKILFLNNPWIIIPSDTLNNKAVGVRTNKYHDFHAAVCKEKKINTLQFVESLNPVLEYLYTIEDEFKGELKRIDVIRHNRYIDKMLWILGQDQSSSFGHGLSSQV